MSFNSFLVVAKNEVQIPLKHETTVGRAAENTLQIPEHTVSKHHACITRLDNDHCYVTDLDSINGTFVNGAHIAAGAKVKLEHNDTLQFGRSIVKKIGR